MSLCLRGKPIIFGSMKILISSLLGLTILACNNSTTTTDKSKVDTTSTRIDRSILPIKVTGSFTGMLPCSNCSGVEVLLRITDTGFWKFQNFKEAKDKSHSVAAENGKCRQDSGAINLFFKNNTKETYKIISQDSLLLVTLTTTVKKNKMKNYLVRTKR